MSSRPRKPSPTRIIESGLRSAIRSGSDYIPDVIEKPLRDVLSMPDLAVPRKAATKQKSLAAKTTPTPAPETNVTRKKPVVKALPATTKPSSPAVKEKQIAQVMPPPRTVAEYVDPVAAVNPEWNWAGLPEVYEKLGGMSEIPPHVIDFGRFMEEQAARAAGQGLTPRDLIKAFTITRASIQRQATDAENLRRAGLDLPVDVTGKVRPEGAFGEWLGTPAGQAYLDAAQYGRLSDNAIGDAVAQMKPFGKQNDLRNALEWAALNLPGQQSQVSDLVAAGREMASTPSDWRVFTKDVKGIGPSKSGFLASLLGRGDQPTLDARQIILNTGRPTKEASKYIARRGGLGGVEGVERLSARQEALDFALPEELRPYYQHLAHHAIWDKAGDEVTTHSDVVKAMKGFAIGGRVDRNRR